MPDEKGVWHESGKTRRTDEAKASLRNKGTALAPRLAQYRWHIFTAGIKLGIVNWSHAIRVTLSINISAFLPLMKQLPPLVRENEVRELLQDSINRCPATWNLVNEPESAKVQLILETSGCIGNLLLKDIFPDRPNRVARTYFTTSLDVSTVIC